MDDFRTFRAPEILAERKVDRVLDLGGDILRCNCDGSIGAKVSTGTATDTTMLVVAVPTSPPAPLAPG